MRASEGDDTGVVCRVDTSSAARGNSQKSCWLTYSGTVSVREQNISSERWDLASTYLVRYFGQQDVRFSRRTSMYELHTDGRTSDPDVPCQVPVTVACGSFIGLL